MEPWKIRTIVFAVGAVLWLGCLLLNTWFGTGRKVDMEFRQPTVLYVIFVFLTQLLLSPVGVLYNMYVAGSLRRYCQLVGIGLHYEMQTTSPELRRSLYEE